MCLLASKDNSVVTMGFVISVRHLVLSVSIHLALMSYRRYLLCFHIISWRPQKCNNRPELLSRVDCFGAVVGEDLFR